ncbi:MAG: hypothetical protein E7521_09350 [Ruminococcaceae bacterium]|nr:hypothetical protein [Oscillospiraceae bacterium]MBE6811230.1 hypothetical protein [Oscillospiraceae bacterium]
MDRVYGSIETVWKKTAAKFFQKFVAPKVKKLSSTIIKVAAKVLMWIGQSKLASLITAGANSAVAAILKKPLWIVSNCTSVGGLIATLADYLSDKKLNGIITNEKLPN